MSGSVATLSYNVAATMLNPSRIPLVLILTLSATMELLLNRIGVHLVSRPSLNGSLGASVFDLGGLFFLYLTGTLALCVFTWAVVILIRDRRLLRVTDRIAFTAMSALFLPLATMKLFFELPEPMLPYLNIGFGALLVVLVWGFMRRPAALRARLGVLYLCAPILLHVVWLASQQLPGSASSDYSEIFLRIYESAEHLVVVGAFAAFLFFAPFPRISNLFEPIPVALAGLLTAGVALLAKYHYIETAQAAYNGLRINLPTPSAHGVMHLAALFVLALTIGTLIRRAGPSRATGLGLALIGVSGFHLQESYQLLLTLIGMMQVLRASREAAAPGAEVQARSTSIPSSENWAAYLGRLAESCSRPPGGGEAVQLQNDGQQIAYVRGRRGDLPFTLRMLHDAGGIQRFEVLVGSAPKDPAQLSLTRKRGSRGQKISDRSVGQKVKLEGDLERQFTIQDNTDRAPGLLGDAVLCGEIERLIHGWLGLWPGEGVRYLAHPGADGWPLPLAEVAFSPEDASTEEIEDLLTLLDGLARRTDVK
jgi:hypothetical protein